MKSVFATLILTLCPFAHGDFVMRDLNQPVTAQLLDQGAGRLGDMQSTHKVAQYLEAGRLNLLKLMRDEVLHPHDLMAVSGYVSNMSSELIHKYQEPVKRALVLAERYFEIAINVNERAEAFIREFGQKEFDRIILISGPMAEASSTIRKALDKILISARTISNASTEAGLPGAGKVAGRLGKLGTWAMKAARFVGLSTGVGVVADILLSPSAIAADEDYLNQRAIGQASNPSPSVSAGRRTSVGSAQ